MKLKEFFVFNKGLLTIITIFVIIGCGLTAYGNYLLTPMANAVKNTNQNRFILFLGFMLSITILSYGLRDISQYLYSKYEQKYIHTLRERMVKNYYDNSVDTKNVAEMQNNLTNDLNILTETYLDPLFKIATFILDIIFSAAAVLTFNFWLLLLIIVLAVTLLFLPKLLAKPLQKLTNNISKKNQSYINIIQKWLSGLAILQRYRVKNKLLSTLSKGSLSLEKARVQKDKKLAQINILSATFNMLAQGFILLLTGFLIINNNLTFGVFFSIGNFASLIFSELIVLNQNVTLVQSAKDLNSKLKNQLEEPITADHNSSDDIQNFATLDLTDLQKKFKNGESISYPDIHINAGEKVLLSGDSGTGKSTLFKLILNQIHPTSGQILFKDKTGKVIKPNLSQIGYIPQDPILFPGTIEDNITMFDTNLNEAASEYALKMQLAHDLKKFPQGIKTPIDLDKNNLSGGQRQKLVLARTKVHNSKLILIDEGTSAIDETATLNILKNLLKGDETIIFIAHNWSSKLHLLFDKEINLSK